MECFAGIGDLQSKLEILAHEMNWLQTRAFNSMEESLRDRVFKEDLLLKSNHFYYLHLHEVPVELRFEFLNEGEKQDSTLTFRSGIANTSSQSSFPHLASQQIYR